MHLVSGEDLVLWHDGKILARNGDIPPNYIPWKIVENGDTVYADICVAFGKCDLTIVGGRLLAFRDSRIRLIQGGGVFSTYGWVRLNMTAGLAILRGSSEVCRQHGGIIYIHGPHRVSDQQGGYWESDHPGTVVRQMGGSWRGLAPHDVTRQIDGQWIGFEGDTVRHQAGGICLSNSVPFQQTGGIHESLR